MADIASQEFRDGVAFGACVVVERLIRAEQIVGRVSPSMMRFAASSLGHDEYGGAAISEQALREAAHV